jgi:hypothetical protein
MLAWSYSCSDSSRPQEISSKALESFVQEIPKIGLRV